MANRIRPDAFTKIGTPVKGRFRFYGFSLYLSEGIQFYPHATINELKHSWKITKRLLKTRAAPMARRGTEQGVSGIFVYRNARILGEESLTRRLAATKFTSKEVIFLLPPESAPNQIAS
jgi:hypothetical protein